MAATGENQWPPAGSNRWPLTLIGLSPVSSRCLLISGGRET